MENNESKTPIKPNIVKPNTSSPNSVNPVAANVKPKVAEIKQSKNNLIKEDDTEEKKKRRKLLLIIFFIIIGIALIATAIYFVSKIPKKEIDFTIILETKINASFEDEFGQMQKIKYMPGDNIQGYLNIKLDDLNNSGGLVYLRFKVGVEVDGNYYSDLFQPWFTPSQADNWYGNGAGVGENSGDNYYYYCGICNDGFEIKAFDYLDFIPDRENNFLNGKEGKIIFTVEILDGNYYAIGQEWNTSPDAWREIVS